MDRAQRLAGLWSWLPAFRAVAESEHLPTAAAALHVSPSALSRSVALLEDAIGYPLFTRLGRRIQLNPAGVTLLASVREAMRRIDDGLGLGAEPRHTRIRAAGHAAWLGLLVVPLLDDLPFTLEHVEIVPTDVRGALLRGTIDLAIAETIPPSDDILVERIGSVARAVCTSARGPGPDGFAVSTDVLDGWPAERPRTIRLRTSRLDVALDACRSGTVRCVAPVAIARAHGLRILRSPALLPSQLYLARRAPLGETTLVTIIDALRARAGRLLR